MNELQTTEFRLTPDKTIHITWELDRSMPGVAVRANWPGGTHLHIFDLNDAKGHGCTPMEYAIQNQNWVVKNHILPKLVKQFNISSDKLLT